LAEDREELRRVFHGPDAPPDVPPGHINDLELLPDRPSQAKLQELLRAVETWRATGPGAPPRAMALEDAPTPVEPRVFVRGNPNNPGAAVPRQFLGVLAGEGAEALHVLHHVGLLQEEVQLLQADRIALELLAEKGLQGEVGRWTWGVQREVRHDRR